MRTYPLFFLGFCLALPGFRANAQDAPPKSLTEYVNPLMGTDSKFSLSNGNTYPAIATPWGMNFWTPMTSAMGGNEPFVEQLDGVFTMPPDFDDSYYGQTIHEIREMQIVNMGNSPNEDWASQPDSVPYSLSRVK